MKLDEIEQIKVCEEIEANKLLKQNFELIKSPVKLRNGEQEKIVFILGKDN